MSHHSERFSRHAFDYDQTVITECYFNITTDERILCYNVHRRAMFLIIRVFTSFLTSQRATFVSTGI